VSNANGTLNLLQATRQYAPESPFIFTSTNKVYGDTPNHLPLVELDSLFGVSKVAADVDLIIQEPNCTGS
jgi:nucleoside-diphosphate-sugar epimerase